MEEAPIDAIHFNRNVPKKKRSSIPKCRDKKLKTQLGKPHYSDSSDYMTLGTENLQFRRIIPTGARRYLRSLFKRKDDIWPVLANVPMVFGKYNHLVVVDKTSNKVLYKTRLAPRGKMKTRNCPSIPSKRTEIPSNQMVALLFVLGTNPQLCTTLYSVYLLIASWLLW